jgi:hypothetical protein
MDRHTLMASQAVKIVDGGKLIIPAQFRRKLGINTGDTAWSNWPKTACTCESLSAAVRRAQALVREFVPDEVGLADELIAERS